MALYAEEPQNFDSTAAQYPKYEKSEKSNNMEYDAEGHLQTGQTMHLQRRLKSRHLQMIAIGKHIQKVTMQNWSSF